MRTLTTRSLLASALVVSLAGCPGGGPGIPGRGGGSVDPNKCGNYASLDGGAQLKALFEATAELEASAKSLELEVRTGCDAMAKELGVDAKGDTRAVCNAVLAQ